MSVATHLCHGKPAFDWNGDLPIFVCRLVTVIVVAFWLFSYCMNGASFANMLQRTMLWWLEPVASIFSEGNSLMHVIDWNTFGFAALEFMDELIPTYIKTNRRTNYFIASSVILIFGVGAIANQVGRLAHHRPGRGGMDGPLAACAGYAGAALRNKSLWTSVLLFDMSLDMVLKNYLRMRGGYLLVTRNFGALATMVVGVFLAEQFWHMHKEWLWERYTYTENLRSMWNGLWKPFAGR